jgi:hypothetical protein
VREIVSKIFLPFPECGKPSQKFFCRFLSARNRLKKFFAISSSENLAFKSIARKTARVFLLKKSEKPLTNHPTLTLETITK